MPNSATPKVSSTASPTSHKHTKSSKKPAAPDVITPAKIAWQTDDAGNQAPVSGEFGDVYFSHADGLAESRHVFLAHNNLPERLANLADKQCFTIAELGFGTGLNFLATWQLWRQLREQQPHLANARLHFITTEKYPIPLADLTQILSLWAQRAPELAELINELLANYPPLLAGCHRLNFIADNITLDIWLGDAGASLASLATFDNLNNGTAIKRPYIDAWFLDGFAPSCNESLWAESIFAQMQRLSRTGTTAATYSCAGIVKRGLQAHGFSIKKVKGFGRKREMLTAVMAGNAESLPDSLTQNDDNDICVSPHPHDHIPSHTVVIGAGVAGLLTAWTLANRGMTVTLVDKVAPLTGASGNPRALLAPNMTPIHHVYEHLHSIGYLYSGRLYRYFNQQAALQQMPLILEQTGTLDLLIKTNIGPMQIADYPDEMATTITAEKARQLSGLNIQDLTDNLYLPKSGLINPQALKTLILKHPNITYQQLSVTNIQEKADKVIVTGDKESGSGSANNSQTPATICADNVVICAAYESHQLDNRIVKCRTIRGQLSWFTPTTEQIARLPKLPLKYSGYCAPFIGQRGDAEINYINEGQPQFLLGASFVDADASIDIREEENQQNYDKLHEDIPELSSVLPDDTSAWQARAGVRTQTIDYHPLVGRLAQSRRIWTLSAMGAKGYALAPICAEVLADMMLGCFAPLSAVMLARLSPNRARLHKAQKATI